MFSKKNFCKVSISKKKEGTFFLYFFHIIEIYFPRILEWLWRHIWIHTKVVLSPFVILVYCNESFVPVNKKRNRNGSIDQNRVVWNAGWQHFGTWAQKCYGCSDVYLENGREGLFSNAYPVDWMSRNVTTITRSNNIKVALYHYVIHR